jgi:hypothetical protein
MENKDIKKFTAIIYGLAEEFGGTVSKSGIDLKFDSLKKYSIEEIVMAANWIVNNREEKYPPVPTTKEIISAIEKINGKINPKTNAEFQVDIIFKYFNYYGSYCDHVFKDSITNYLMSNRWSFRQIGMMPESELKWFRKSFVDAYTEMEKHEASLIEYSGTKGTIPIADLKLLVNK